jgi:RNA polymerase sigma-70 factor (ECF subfamily)
LKLYRARDSYEPKSRFSTYLYRIATNHCINLHARVERRLVVSDTEAIDRARPGARNQHDALSNDELRASLQVALEKLPKPQRAALLLVHYEGLSYRDAAEVIEVSEGAVKSLIHRARTMLMVELAPLLDAGNEVKHAL